MFPFRRPLSEGTTNSFLHHVKCPPNNPTQSKSRPLTEAVPSQTAAISQERRIQAGFQVFTFLCFASSQKDPHKHALVYKNKTSGGTQKNLMANNFLALFPDFKSLVYLSYFGSVNKNQKKDF